LIEPIYMTLEGCGSLSLSKFHFAFSKIGVSHELIFIPIIK
jgi:hypothetical protein